LWQTYEKIFYDILPKAVAQYDSSKFYWPSSPSSTYYNPANRKSGDEHDWSIWFGQALFTQYEKDLPRFVSEYGMQAMPEMATIRSFADEKDFDIRSEVLHKRQRSAMNWVAPDYNGNDMIEWYVNQYYKKPKDFESFVYVSQLMQALGLKTAIEAHRRNMPNCMGSLYWQIDDCWPTISWASVDWYGRWKASHYAIKNAFATFMISPVIENGKVNVYLVSDSLKPVNAKLTTALFDFQGKRLWQKDSAIIVKPNTSMLSISESESVILRNQNKQKVVLKVELRIEDIQVASNYLYFAPLKNLALEKPGLKYSTTKTEYGFKINITTEKLVKNAYIYTRNIEGKFSNNYFDIIPGETVVVDFYSSKPVDNPENEISIISLMDTYK